MTLLGSQQTALGSVPTAAEGVPGGSGPGAGVTQIIPGAGISVSPPAGTGVVTVTNTDTQPTPGPAPPNNGALSTAGTAATFARSDHTHGSMVADWALATTRFFACDGTNGNDANTGFSDVSMAAAGVVAVKTLDKLLSIIPRIGNGRTAVAAIASGSYTSASDAQISLGGYAGYFNLALYGTNTNASAGATAFAGNATDAVNCGAVNATGMNAAGYNATAYSVAADGTPTMTVQLAGGGAAGFGAMPARPYGCRLRGVVTTATGALQNFCAAIIGVSAGNQLILSLPLPAGPVTGNTGDVFAIEMPGVIISSRTLIHGSGSISNQSGVVSLSVAGLQMGTLYATGSTFKLAFCESGVTRIFDCYSVFIENNGNVVSFGAVGSSLRSGLLDIQGGTHQAAGWTSTTTATYTQLERLSIERSSAAGMIVYGGADGGGNNIVTTLGTNSSTVHGASCQIWAPQSGTPGVNACGLALEGSAYVGRIRFSNMGANPGIRINGAGLGVVLSGPSGGAADGNTDVGVDFGPQGLSGNTIGAMGCTVAAVGTPTLTGSNGDIRTAAGQIISWAQVTASGFVDQCSNRVFDGNGPLMVVGKFSGVIVTSGAGATATQLGDPGSQPLIASNSSNNEEYPTSLRLISRLRVCAISGNGATPYTVTLYRRPSGGAQAPTSMVVTVPAGAGVGQTFADLAHATLFADGDTFALQIDSGATGEGNKVVNATLEGPA